jgi:hypothetical protein
MVDALSAAELGNKEGASAISVADKITLYEYAKFRNRPVKWATRPGKGARCGISCVPGLGGAVEYSLLHRFKQKQEKCREMLALHIYWFQNS